MSNDTRNGICGGLLAVALLVLPPLDYAYPAAPEMWLEESPHIYHLTDTSWRITHDTTTGVYRLWHGQEVVTSGKSLTSLEKVGVAKQKTEP